MTTISHKIELKPNNKQKTHFRKAFGCARLAYNWGLAEWQRRYKEGEKVDAYGLKKSFNAVKKEQYPFVLEVTKYATQQPFINLGKAFKKFFDDLKKGSVSYPRFKKKKDIKDMFCELGIGDKMDVPVGKMSFGQQQRVALIRTLCQPFDFLFLDEPISHLDDVNARNMARILTEEAMKQGAGVIATSIGKPLELDYTKKLLL